MSHTVKKDMKVMVPVVKRDVPGSSAPGKACIDIVLPESRITMVG